jgi:hypothetical protein
VQNSWQTEAVKPSLLLIAMCRTAVKETQLIVETSTFPFITNVSPYSHGTGQGGAGWGTPVIYNLPRIFRKYCDAFCYATTS